MNKDGMLRVRIEQDQIKAFKDKCENAEVKYTIVIRNLIQIFTNRPDSELKILGRKK